MSNGTLRPGIALALSGGGFRATLFHIGTLIRLNELGFLPQLDRISAVSGGSIAAGMLACRWETLKAVGFAPSSLDLVTQPLRKFCSRNIDASAISEGTISPWSSINEVLAREYDELWMRRGLSGQAAHGLQYDQPADRPRLPHRQGAHGRLSDTPTCARSLHRGRQRRSTGPARRTH